MQIDLSMRKFEKFAEDFEKYMGNLANTANVFESLVTPVATKSGSELLLGLLDDTREVTEEFKNKAVAGKNAASDIKGYTSKLEKLNRL